MNDWDDPPRSRDEWRVEVVLDKDQHGESLSKRLDELRIDDEARKRLGGSVTVTRDGRFIFLYAWHEESAQEAERIVRNIMENDELVGQVRLMRWHPVAEEWKDAAEELPEDEAAVAQEMHEREAEGAVLVVHSPPKGHCDESSAGDHLGSEAILEAIEAKRPRLAVCGHIHESWGAESEVGPTPVINLGPSGRLIDL